MGTRYDKKRPKIGEELEIEVLNKLKTYDLTNLKMLDLSTLRLLPHDERIGLALELIGKSSSINTLKLDSFLRGRPERREIISTYEIGSIKHFEQSLEKAGNNPRAISGRFSFSGEANFDSIIEQIAPPEGHAGNPDLREIGNATLLNSNLNSLSLQDNGMATAEAISGLQLDQNTSLRTLSLAQNPLSDSAIEKIAEIFKSNPSITELDLSDCPITPRGFEILGNMLVTNTNLTSLRLRISKRPFVAPYFVDGLSHLAAALKENKTLTTLDLSGRVIPLDFHQDFRIVTNR